MSKLSFKSFLVLREGRTADYGNDAESVIGWLEQYAPKFIKGKSPIWRGISGSGGNTFKLGDSNSGEPRVSQNTANYYTLWMDNHPKFEDFPKRSRSFIASYDRGYAEDFGRLYLMIPADSNKAADVNETDIWNHRVIDDAAKLNYLMDMTDNAFDNLGIKHPETWEELKIALKDVTIEEFIDEFKPSTKRTVRDYAELHQLNNLYDIYNYELNPKKFTLKKSSELSKHPPSEQNGTEVWVQGPAMFIPMSGLDDAIENERFLEWAKENSPMIYDVLNHPDSGWNDDREVDDPGDPDNYSTDDVLTDPPRNRR